MKKIKQTVLLVSIVAIGSSLRLYKLGQIPGGAHRDELAIGYNAYSLLETGKDEHGQTYPLNFKSLNDYKLPGQIYTTALSLKIGGRNLWAVRLPTAIFGSLFIISAFLFSRFIFLNNKISNITTGLTALSLWHFTASRNGYEPIAGLTLSLTALFFLGQAIVKNKKIWLNSLLGLFFYFISTLFYNSPIIAMPLLTTSFVLISQIKSKSKFNKKNWLIAGLTLIVSFFIFTLFKNVSSSRVGTIIINNPAIIKQINQTRIQYLQAGLPQVLAKILVNKPVIYIKQFISGYFSAFDFSYLFTQGDHNPWHSLRMIKLGTFNLVLIPFLGIGLFKTIRLALKRNRTGLLLISLLLISPIANGLTIDAPISNRLMLFHFSLTLIISLGIFQAFKLIGNKTSHSLAYLLILLIFVSYLWPLSRYFGLYNQNLSQAWNPNFKQVVAAVSEKQDKYDLIYVTPKVDTAYLQFAFFGPIQPELIQTQAKWNKQGLWQVEQLDKYRFSQEPNLNQIKKDYSQILLDKNLEILIVNTAGNLPNDAILLETVNDYQDKPLWIVYSQTIKQPKLNE